jgi:hypothetical protein
MVLTYKTKPVSTVPESKELHIEKLHHVMQSLPCKNQAVEGCVNIVQECKGWRMPEESRMELEAAEEEAFSSTSWWLRKKRWESRSL